MALESRRAGLYGSSSITDGGFLDVALLIAVAADFAVARDAAVFAVAPASDERVCRRHSS